MIFKNSSNPCQSRIHRELQNSPQVALLYGLAVYYRPLQRGPLLNEVWHCTGSP